MTLGGGRSSGCVINVPCSHGGDLTRTGTGAFEANVGGSVQLVRRRDGEMEVVGFRATVQVKRERGRVVTRPWEEF